MEALLPPVILNCLPKAGTHLIKKLFEHLSLYNDVGFTLSRKIGEKYGTVERGCLVGVADPVCISAASFGAILDNLKDNRYAIGHVAYCDVTKEMLESRKIRMLTLLRDPRDVACSLVFYILRSKGHFLHGYFSSLPDMTARLKAVIDGIEPSPMTGGLSLKPIAEQFKSIAHWESMTSVHAVFYEALVGENGGGDRLTQARAVSAILNFLEYPLAEVDIDDVCSKIYSRDSATFRTGKTGDWRNWFTVEIAEYFERHVREVLMKDDIASGLLESAAIYGKGV
jgi:hypothetical protein